MTQFEQSATTTASHDTAKPKPLKKNTSLIPSFAIVEPGKHPSMLTTVANLFWVGFSSEMILSALYLWRYASNQELYFQLKYESLKRLTHTTTIKKRGRKDRTGIYCVFCSNDDLLFGWMILNHYSVYMSKCWYASPTPWHLKRRRIIIDIPKCFFILTKWKSPDERKRNGGWTITEQLC